MNVLTISIPVFNDEQSIIQLVEDIMQMKSVLPLFKILIINDGSTDNTLNTIQTLQEKYAEIEIWNHEQNLGFGVTIAEVVKLPTTEWIMFLSGDNQFPAKNIVEFLKYKNDFDFILGHRMNRKDSWVRKMNSFIYNRIVEIYSGHTIQDINSVFLCKSVLFREKVFLSNSAFVHAEIVLTALKNNARFKVISIEHTERKHGVGSGGKLKVILPVILDLVKYFIKRE